MNNSSQGLNLIEYMASGINTEDEVFKVLFSDDEGNGAGAIELDKVLAFINYYTKTDDVRNHKGYTLEMIVKEFTGFRRMMYELDSIYLRRFLAITERKKDEVWGTKWNLQHVFEAYFNWVKIYVSECTNNIAKNLLINGDFEDDEDNSWDIGGEAEYTGDARFSGKQGLFFNGMPGTCKQDISDLQNGVYAFHFFIEGKCGVKIKNSQGKYWDATARPNKYILKWQDEEFINEFKGDVWQDVFCFIILPEIMDITIEFVSLENEDCCIDYARLFKKPLNPSYTVIVQYEGYQTTDQNLHLAKGKDDPIDGVDYSMKSYFDHHYIVGRMGEHRREIFNFLLEIIRPLGIQSFLEFIEKEYVDVKD